jgi:hypothetical protein
LRLAFKKGQFRARGTGIDDENERSLHDEEYGREDRKSIKKRE